MSGRKSISICPFSETVEISPYDVDGDNCPVVKNTFISFEPSTPRPRRHSLDSAAESQRHAAYTPARLSMVSAVSFHIDTGSEATSRTSETEFTDASEDLFDTEASVSETTQATSTTEPPPTSRPNNARGRTRNLNKFCTQDAPRTTVMIRNIPCRYRQGELLEELAPACDFFYLPMDTRKKLASLGYAFVNFRTEEAAEAFMKKMDNYVFQRSMSSKRGAACWATVQGLRANCRFYRKTWVSRTQHSPWLAPEVNVRALTRG